MDEKQAFDIISEYFKDRGVVGYQLRSFNNLINFGLQNIIDQEANLSITPKRGQKYEVSFGQVWVAPPQVIEENRKIFWSSPTDARIRDLTYNSAIHCDITETFIDEKGEKEETVHTRTVLGRIPIMLRSERCNLYGLSKVEQTAMGECPNDPGGYFVIQGKERVLVGQIRTVYNKVFVIKQKPSEKFKYIAEVRSMSEETGHSVLLKVMIGVDDRTLCFSLPYIKELIPIGIVFKAMGYTDSQDIIDLIGLDLTNTRKYMRIITRDAFAIETKDEALEYIGKHAMHIITKETWKKYAWQVVETELLPHLGVSGTIKEKACFLGQMVNKLLTTSVGLRSCDDRDSYANRRVEISGILIYDLFRTLFKRFVGELKEKLEKKKQRPDVIATITRMKGIITKGLQVGFTSGNWGAYKNAYVKTGVSQILDRMTWPATISHLHRLNIPMGKEGKNMEIRQIHSSQIALICPAECFDPNTPILMWDGHIKLAKEIKVGDLLIDEKGQSTRVKSICSGYKEMYKICHTKNNFSNYTVTSNHILTLKSTLHKQVSKCKKSNKFYVLTLNKDKLKHCYKQFATREEAQEYSDSITDDAIIDISIEDYLKLSQYMKSKLRTFKCDSIDWPSQDVELDPYILGMWLGDGLSNGYGFSTADDELLTIWKKWAAEHDTHVHHYHIRPNKHGNFCGAKVAKHNTLNDKLSRYNLVNNKHIPKQYLVNSRTARLKLLAGLIDTNGNVTANGYEIHICQGPNNTSIITDLILVVQSLGFSCHVKYTEITITGSKLYEIPTRLVQKNSNLHKQKSDFLQSNFTLEKKDIEPFVGWQLEGNGRFLLGDCIVTHNTPEGKSAGIALNATIMADFSRKIQSVLVKETIEKCSDIVPIEDVKIVDIRNMTRIFLNGALIAYTQNPDEVVTFVRKMRKCGRLDKEVSIAYDEVDEDIHIYCDEGRMLRPLLTMKNNTLRIKNKKYTWKQLLRKNYIQYLDASEIESCVIAMYPPDTKIQENDFCEIHPVVMLGVIAAMIPFPDHSQSPRNCYQASMGKQAIGVPVLSSLQRADTLLYILHYPQRPLVSTKIGDMLGYNEMPSGINAIVAIISAAFNQEDSIILNKSAVERGMFILTQYKNIEETEKKGDSYSTEMICIPPMTTNEKNDNPHSFKRKHANYSMLETECLPECTEENCHVSCKKGIIKIGMHVKKGDVLVGKIITKSSKTGLVGRTDISRVTQEDEEGIVDRIFATITPNGYKLVKIVLRNEKIPEVGDKFASTAAQKGTVGMVYRQHELPFTEDGIVPDIIINPHCLSGDTVIKLSDGTSAYIKDIYTNQNVSISTIDPNTLEKSTTNFTNGFVKTPSQLLLVTTTSGRKVKCTPEHMWLVVRNDKLQWIETKDICCYSDKIIMSHTVLPVRKNNGTPLVVNCPNNNTYWKRLQSIGLTGTIPEEKTMILARLIGALDSDGYSRGATLSGSVLYLGELEDYYEVCKDMDVLGFNKPSILKNTDGCYRVELEVACGVLLQHLGTCATTFPVWLKTASDAVKREYLSGYAFKFVVDDNTVSVCPITMRNIDYITCIQELMNHFGIKSTLRQYADFTDLKLAISIRQSNLLILADYIGYRYCNHKRRVSTIAIEYLKSRQNGMCMSYEHFTKCFMYNSLNVTCFVQNITETEIEPVYDFTTISTNHSFVANGLVSHNCIPSRMTVNQLITCALGKVAAISGEYGDATPFTHYSVNVADKVCNRLEELGLQEHKKGRYLGTPIDEFKHGWERMYGANGEEFDAKIFIGPTYYQRLKHMVSNKMHARDKGRITQLTRQPLEGRSRDGGLRFGEMERDCMLAHGASSFIQERLFKVSDPYSAPVCMNPDCGQIAAGVDQCHSCGEDSIETTRMPYATKLLVQELQSMNLKMVIHPSK